MSARAPRPTVVVDGKVVRLDKGTAYVVVDVVGGHGRVVVHQGRSLPATKRHARVYGGEVITATPAPVDVTAEARR